jgi:hypothetical protein
MTANTDDNGVQAPPVQAAPTPGMGVIIDKPT